MPGSRLRDRVRSQGAGRREGRIPAGGTITVGVGGGKPKFEPSKRMISPGRGIAVGVDDIVARFAQREIRGLRSQLPEDTGRLRRASRLEWEPVPNVGGTLWFRADPERRGEAYASHIRERSTNKDLPMFVRMWWAIVGRRRLTQELGSKATTTLMKRASLPGRRGRR